jgi:phosphoribosylanthranilate isomerase
MIVKICGTTDLDDALCAVDSGADMLGFIFYPPSPRNVSARTAKEIARVVRLTANAVKLVGVFVNESVDHMTRVVEEVGLDCVQLHGDESVETLSAMNGRAYKAIRKWSDANRVFVERLNATHSHNTFPQLMLDADHATLFGGTGERADESLASQLAKDYRLLLAGGLTPDNIVDTIRAVQPWGVDVASGVEASKGRKDHAKVRAFVNAAKSALC